jgi:hypothetical protein
VNVWNQIRQQTRRHIVLIAVLVTAVLLVSYFLASIWFITWSESTAFCGGICHSVMNPEATTHSISPHANVECGECHVGTGTIQRVWMHLQNARYAVTYPLGLYSRPLETPLSTLRPVEASCLPCHWPSYFYPIQTRVDDDYGTDEANSVTHIVVALRIGNTEESPPGYGAGSHWHIEQPLYYVATDPDRQQIVQVQAEVNGETRVYQAAGVELPDNGLQTAQRRLMDCMDCHNRATHIVMQPSEAIDTAMANGQIAADLPYIKQQGTEVLEKRYDSDTQAREAISAIISFYQLQYPDLYAKRGRDIIDAVQELLVIYHDTHFPQMNVYWDTYPDNIGHKDFPGCFRCHDGAHLTDDGQAIPADCNFCHILPQVAGPGEELPAVTLEAPTPPDSHQTSLWLARHPYAFSNECTACHKIVDPAGTSNSGFCSNPLCHGQNWTYLHIDQPEVVALVRPEWPPQRAPGQEGVPPAINHPTDIGETCLRCHRLDGPLPYPESHVELSLDQCLVCHQPATTARQIQ